MNLLNLLFNRKKYKKPAKLTASNIKGFTQAHLREFLYDMDILLPDSYIKEQSIWRLHKVAEKSPECLAGEGDCKICGCSITSKVYEDRGCSNEAVPCYPPMMSELEWKQFKLDNNIEII